MEQTGSTSGRDSTGRDSLPDAGPGYADLRPRLNFCHLFSRWGYGESRRPDCLAGAGGDCPQLGKMPVPADGAVERSVRSRSIADQVAEWCFRYISAQVLGSRFRGNDGE